MSGYGQVQRSVWQDDEFLDLSRDAKLAWLYLLTNPHGNGLGAFKLPTRHAQLETGLEPQELEHALQELSLARWIQFCSHTEYLWLPKYLKYNAPRNGNVARALMAKAADLPDEFEFKSDLLDLVAKASERFGNQTRPVSNKSPTGGEQVGNKSSKVPNTEHEHEHEQEQEQEKEKANTFAQSSSADRPANGLFGPSPSKLGSGPTNGTVGNERLNTHPDHRPFIAVELVAPAGVERLWVIRTDEVEAYQRDYPHLDVEGELRKFRAWCRDNPTRRKTAKGIRRAMSGWLNRAQDGNGRRRV